MAAIGTTVAVLAVIFLATLICSAFGFGEACNAVRRSATRSGNGRPWSKWGSASTPSRGDDFARWS
jgi:hypothetical protein